MRLAHLHPDELTTEQRALHAVLTEGPRRTVHAALPPGVGMADDEGRLLGPFNAFLHHPKVGTALQEVTRVLRFDGVLSPAHRELAILVTAAAERSDFEWGAHAAIAVGTGVPQAAVDAIGRGGAPVLDDPADAAVVALARSLVERGDADDDVYEAARTAVGEAGVIEVATIVGVYRLLALQMRLFRVPGPPGPWGPPAP